MAADPVLVVGAGAGGLAVAAELRRRDVPVTVLERSESVGASWRGRYDRLHLHTTRTLSQLPGLPLPRSAGRWVRRDDVVRYLEAYARHHRLDVRTGVEVTRVDRGLHGGWLLRTAQGTALAAPQLVLATGYSHTAQVPHWPGVETYPGEVVHSARYRSAAPYRGRDVLVVGPGNSGAEIAVDLAEGGASRVRLAVRTPPHIVRRSTLGWPAQRTGVLVRHLPVVVVDAVARAQVRVSVPDLTTYGLPRPSTGLYTRVLQGAQPVQDVGLIAAVRAGNVVPVAAVQAFDGRHVVLADDSRITPDAVVAATGYRPALEPLVGHLGVLDDRGRPTVRGSRTAPGADGLYVTGYTTPISGQLRELGIDARRIARAIARQRAGRR
jgi:cation diffusion facilitator CzcD-associated flavoprotein CzcO